MATITIDKSYFDALLRKAEFQNSNRPVNSHQHFSNNVTISKAEHDFLLQAVREYRLLKTALFRGGLTTETLNTLLQGETGTDNDDSSYYDLISPTGHDSTTESVSFPDDTLASARALGVRRSMQPNEQNDHFRSFHRVASYDEHASFMESPSPGNDDHDSKLAQRIPLRDQRTVLVTNLHERTTHNDIANIVRGGRLLDIFLRNDRSATISFIEGAADFLAYAKRNDIYLHMKRLEFRWADRQFHVPSHVSNKIASGATRNLVVRGVAGKITAEQIRDHLDHIHNLFVVDIYFEKGDAYISTNSIHNALFARTCMMSRAVYKGARIEYYPDECAGPLPRPKKTQTPVPFVPMRPKTNTVVNQYALLDTGTDDSSESEEEPYLSHGVQVDGYHWADPVVA